MDISRVAVPRFESGKNQDRLLKLVRKTFKLEKEQRASGKTVRLLRRGVVEVNKAVRQGEKGLLILAWDIHPVDVTAHLPLLCEEKGMAYAYAAGKRELGACLGTSRPTAVLLVREGVRESSDKLAKAYDKAFKLMKKANPYM